MNEKVIGLDIETLDWFDQPGTERLTRDEQIDRMRLGVAVTIGPDPEDAAAKVWCPCPTLGTQALVEWLMEQADDGRATIVGWNVYDFDLRVIWQNAAIAPRVADLFARWEGLAVRDMMAEIRHGSYGIGRGSVRRGIPGGRWYKLGDIADYNLGEGKSGNGLKAVEWLRSGDPALVQQAIDYCRKDVELTLKLYWLARGDGLLLPAREERGEEGGLRYFIRNNGEFHIEVAE